MTDQTIAIDDIAANYFNAWNAPAAERKKAIVAAFVDDAYYCDGSAEASGTAAIAKMIAAVMQQFEGARFERTSPIDAHHNQARFAWRMHAADGRTIVDGIDAIRFDDNGRIHQVLGFFGVAIPEPSGTSTPHTFRWERSYDVPAARLFAVISDEALYAEIAPNLRSIKTVSGEGVGRIRECTDTDGACFTETYIEWVEGKRFATRVHIDTYPEGLRAMITALEASWTVTPITDGSSKVNIEINAELTDLGLQVLRDGGGADALFNPVLDGWATHLA